MDAELAKTVYTFFHNKVVSENLESQHLDVISMGYHLFPVFFSRIINWCPHQTGILTLITSQEVEVTSKVVDGVVNPPIPVQEKLGLSGGLVDLQITVLPTRAFEIAVSGDDQVSLRFGLRQPTAAVFIRLLIDQDVFRRIGAESMTIDLIPTESTRLVPEVE